MDEWNDLNEKRLELKKQSNTYREERKNAIRKVKSAESLLLKKDDAPRDILERIITTSTKATRYELIHNDEKYAHDFQKLSAEEKSRCRKIVGSETIPDSVIPVLLFSLVGSSIPVNSDRKGLPSISILSAAKIGMGGARLAIASAAGLAIVGAAGLAISRMSAKLKKEEANNVEANNALDKMIGELEVNIGNIREATSKLSELIQDDHTTGYSKYSNICDQAEKVVTILTTNK